MVIYRQETPGEVLYVFFFKGHVTRKQTCVHCSSSEAKDEKPLRNGELRLLLMSSEHADTSTAGLRRSSNATSFSRTLKWPPYFLCALYSLVNPFNWNSQRLAQSIHLISAD